MRQGVVAVGPEGVAVVAFFGCGGGAADAVLVGVVGDGVEEGVGVGAVVGDVDAPFGDGEACGEAPAATHAARSATMSPSSAALSLVSASSTEPARS